MSQLCSNASLPTHKEHLMKHLLAATTAFGLLAGAAHSTEIINFSGGAANNNFIATNPTLATTHLSIANQAVSFTLFGSGATSGFMTLTADSTSLVTQVGGIDIQHFNGTFSILNSTGTINYLSGTFTDAALGVNGGTGLDVNVASPPETLSLTSSVVPSIDLAPPSAFDISLSNLIPPLGVTTGDSIAAFSSSFTGDASASAVPEPASLALLGVGILGLGLVANRKRSV